MPTSPDLPKFILDPEDHSVEIQLVEMIAGTEYYLEPHPYRHNREVARALGTGQVVSVLFPGEIDLGYLVLEGTGISEAQLQDLVKANGYKTTYYEPRYLDDPAPLVTKEQKMQDEILDVTNPWPRLLKPTKDPQPRRPEPDPFNVEF